MKGKLALVAGAGGLPGKIIAACKAEARPLFIIALEGFADKDVIGDGPQAWIRLGAVGTGVRHLREQGITELVFAGAVRRPSFFELRPDMWTAALFAKAGVRALGDDGMLRALIRELEREGFRVVGVDEVLGGLLATAGNYGHHVPDEMALADIRRGIVVAQALGAADVGQGAVVQQGIVLAVEAIEGTDAMMARCLGLARTGPGGVLVKVKKPGQERRADLPTIGVDTIERAAAAGLRGVAIEVGGAIVLDRSAVVEKADSLGLFVVGVVP
ncbi:MAG: UDP-2,3-diacylglucosamine diphosphatase LpxI [Alphaproteobacteria bacterium]|nr:UDP-2,3-diacylglucosamine diphosphatase LpxI [Alphaproteobacteria bacterium]